MKAEYEARVYKNGIYNCSLLKGKKILVLIPHEDDELITLGSLLPILKVNQCEITFVFSTNGDSKGVDSGKVRLKEALAYSRALGIDEKSIIFMGFGDQGDEQTHIYNSSDVISAPSGMRETYALETHSSFAMMKYGYELTYTRDHYKKALKDIIIDNKADIVFCIDADIHSDHIALSLLFEEVLTELIKEELYQPIVFKMFAHDMLWMGIEDSYGLNLTACRPISDNPNHTYAICFQKSFYQWNERVRFPIEEKYISNFAVRNEYRKTMKIYKSQRVHFHFHRLLNSDQVFWQRRTDNVILFSEVKASSGDTSCFSTIKMYDSYNVCKKQKLLEESYLVWKPSDIDMEKKVTFHFKDNVKIYKLVLYTGFHDTKISEAVIKFDNGMIFNKVDLNKYGQPNIIVLDREVLCKSFEVQFVGSNVEMIKIEAFPKADKENYFTKIMINNNFIYKYIITKKKSHELRLQIYNYSNHGSEIFEADNKNFQWYLRNSGHKEYIDDINSFHWDINKRFCIGVESIKDRNLFDEVEFVKKPFYYTVYVQVYGKIEYIINKIIYKLLRMIK